MQSPYDNYPSLADLPIGERTRFFKQTCVQALQRGDLTLADMLQATEEAIGNEQYELAQGVALAVQEFKTNPQRSLF